ncbi:hypothetical protein COO60DRAFT_338202 [Scenedesmus sp. NREL 46B-D3]|nr:hypothetical protein COO60DRAFT_338202 [Scenedesmus sp. NREL 46B-D3]
MVAPTSCSSSSSSSSSRRCAWLHWHSCMPGVPLLPRRQQGWNSSSSSSSSSGLQNAGVQPEAAQELLLEDALVLLCIADSQSEPPSSIPSTPRGAVAAATKHAALHATLGRCMCRPDHAACRASQQQQQQQQQATVKSVRLLCLRAIGVLQAERQAWCAQQLQRLWCCLKQVRKEMWQQQALAEAAAKPAGSSSLSPRKQAGSGGHGRHISSPPRRAQQRKQPPGRRALPATRAAAGTAAAVHAAAAAAARLAKVLALPAVLAGRADFATAYKGWEGSGFVVRLLLELQAKLWCKLAVQALRGAALVSSDLDVLLQQQHGTALQVLQLSAAFSTWRAWAAARAAARSSYRKAKRRLLWLRQRQVLAAWHAAAVRQGAAAAALAVLQHRQQARMLAKAVKGWRMMHAGWQLQKAKVALAVLWSARVVCARVIVIWAGVAGRAVAIKAAVDADAGSGDGAAGSFRSCSSSFVAALQQQQAWKALMLAALKGAVQMHGEAADAAHAAILDVNCRLPHAQAAVALLLQQRRQRHQKRAAEQVQQLQQQIEQQAALLAAQGTLHGSASQLTVGLSAESSSSSWLSVCASSSDERCQQQVSSARTLHDVYEALRMQLSSEAMLQCRPQLTQQLAAQHWQEQQQQQQQQQQQPGLIHSCHPQHAAASRCEDYFVKVSGAAVARAAAGTAGTGDSTSAVLLPTGASSSSPSSLAYLHQGQQLDETAAGFVVDDDAAPATGVPLDLHEPTQQQQEQQVMAAQARTAEQCTSSNSSSSSGSSSSSHPSVACGARQAVMCCDNLTAAAAAAAQSTSKDGARQQQDAPHEQQQQHAEQQQAVLRSKHHTCDAYGRPSSSSSSSRQAEAGQQHRRAAHVGGSCAAAAADPGQAAPAAQQCWRQQRCTPAS